MNLHRFFPRTFVVTGVLLGLVGTFSGCLTKHIAFKEVGTLRVP